MIVSGPSILGWIAAALYALVVLACLWAAATARAKQQPAAHLRSWVVLALFFAVLIYLRVNNLEEVWRDELRESLRQTDEYGDRRGIQVPLTVGIIVATALGALAWTYFQVRVAGSRRSQTLIAAQLAAGAMVILIGLRMVSFHALDQLLYGPLKLNWIIDLGVAAAVIASAVYYNRLVHSLRKRTKQPGKRSD